MSSGPFIPGRHDWLHAEEFYLSEIANYPEALIENKHRPKLVACLKRHWDKYERELQGVRKSMIYEWEVKDPNWEKVAALGPAALTRQLQDAAQGSWKAT